MAVFKGKAVLAAILFSAGVCMAQVSDLSGTWHLNVEKSHWGKAQKPISVLIQIDHKEPALKYDGTVVYRSDEQRHFSFDGAIDGSEYPLMRSIGSGTVTLKRENFNTISSVFNSYDGTYLETTRTTVSQDGKIMTRHIELKGPDRKINWTEVYEKR